MKKDIETMNKNQLKMKNTVSQMKNTIEGIKSRLDKAVHQISDLEDEVEINRAMKRKKDIKRARRSLRELWYNMKSNNIYIIGIPGEWEQGVENLFEEIMTENFLNLMKEKVAQVKEVQSPNHDEPKETHR